VILIGQGADVGVVGGTKREHAGLAADETCRRGRGTTGRYRVGDGRNRMRRRETHEHTSSRVLSGETRWTRRRRSVSSAAAHRAQEARWISQR